MSSADSTLVPLRLGDETALLENQPKGGFAKHLIDSSKPIKQGSLGAGDSELHTNFLSKEEADKALHAFLNGEVKFQQWYHMPNKRKPKTALQKLRRIKAALCNPEKDGRIPLYRFPVNDQKRYGETIPMPPALEAIRKRASEITGHHYNHAVVLLYKDGDDCIGFHKDKTLDLDDDAPIVSVSLGASRPYVLRDDIRNPSIEQEFIFPHGAMLALGPKTNAEFYHSVRQLSPSEDSKEVRISLTFRKVATFRDKDGKITGKGAKYDSFNWPESINGAHRYDDNLDAALPESKLQGDAKAHAEAVSARKAMKKVPKIDAKKLAEILNSAGNVEGESLKQKKERLVKFAEEEFQKTGFDVQKEGAQSDLTAAVGKHVSKLYFVKKP